MSDSLNDSPPAHPLVGTSPGAPAQSSPPKRNEQDASASHDSNDNNASLTSDSNSIDGLEAPPIGAKASDEEAARKFCRDVLLPASLGGEATTALSQARDALASSFSTSFSTDLDATNKPLRAVIAQTNKLWNKGKEPIFYVFLEGSDSGNEIQRNKVRTTIKEWENYGSFRFKEVTDPTWSATLGSQVIRITFYDKPTGPNAGSWSTIGTDCKTVPMNKPTMNYGEPSSSVHAARASKHGR